MFSFLDSVPSNLVEIRSLCNFYFCQGYQTKIARSQRAPAIVYLQMTTYFINKFYMQEKKIAISFEIFFAFELP